MSQLSLSGFANRKALKDIVTVPKSVQRDRALFLTAFRSGVDTPAVRPRRWVPWEASQVVP